MNIFKKFGRITSIGYENPVKEFPKLCGRLFGGSTCNGRAVVGDSRMQIYEYRVEENSWVPLPSPITKWQCQHCTASKRHLTSICEDKFLLATLQQGGGCSFSILHLSALNQSSRYDDELGPGYPRYEDTYTSPYWSNCTTKVPINRLTNIKKIGGGKLILIGDGKVFEINVCNNMADITWHTLPKLKTYRRDFFSFKMRDTVYLAGGYAYEPLLCCEQLDMNEGKWLTSPYVLPYPIIHASVIVDINETFAIIIGGHNGRRSVQIPSFSRQINNNIAIFTPEKGFLEIDKSGLTNIHRVVDCFWQGTSCSPVLLHIE